MIKNKKVLSALAVSAGFIVGVAFFYKYNKK